MGCFFISLFLYVLSHFINSYCKTGNFSGCCVLVINTFLGSLVDCGCSIKQSALCSFLIASFYSSENLLNSSLNTGLDRLVSVSLSLVY